MIHKFVNNNADKTLVLLHGTGGDENDLLPIAQYIAPNMNYLSLRGNVMVNGMRRFSEVSKTTGFMDEEDMFERVPTLIHEIETLAKSYELGELWALGYSNGANALSAMLLQQETPFSKVILLRAMNIESNTTNPNLKNLEILMHSGLKDAIIPYTSGVALEKHFKDNMAQVEHKVFDLNHRLGQDEINDLKSWFEGKLKQ